MKRSLLPPPHSVACILPGPLCDRVRFHPREREAPATTPSLSEDLGGVKKQLGEIYT